MQGDNCWASLFKIFWLCVFSLSCFFLFFLFNAIHLSGNCHNARYKALMKLQDIKIGTMITHKKTGQIARIKEKIGHNPHCPEEGIWHLLEWIGLDIGDETHWQDTDIVLLFEGGNKSLV
jgi:hypothetical protein